MDNKEYITVKDVAQRLKVSEQTVRRLINNHEIEAIRIHREYRIDVASYRNWLRIHTVNRSQP